MAWRRIAVEPRHAGMHRDSVKAIERRGSKDFWSLYVLLDGDVTVVTPVMKRDLHGPCSWLVPPGAVSGHAAQGRLELFICLFNLHLGSGVIDPLRRLPAQAAPVADLDAARRAVASLAAGFADWRKKDAESALRVRSDLDRLLLDHALAVCAMAAQRPIMQASVTPPPVWLADLCLGMHEHLFDPRFGFRQIVAAAGVSPSLVARMFRVHLGTTALGYLRQIRLELAARLLRNRLDETIASVAGRCGYTSLPLFSRHFSAAYGVGPRAWRKQGQQA